MEFKLKPIKIPPENPFTYDALDRKESVESVAALIEELTGPFVLAINSPWGTGKTTFVQFVQATLEAKNIACIYFNAWETDFASDPLIAFLGELEATSRGHKGKEKAFKANFEKVKSIASVIAKKAIPVAGKIATAGILDTSAFIEGAIADLVVDSINDVVGAYGKEKDLMEKFRCKLATSLDALTGNSDSSQVIIFVDDLDRCRPTYAVELLERIKHLFNVENAIFVLSLDKQQLGVNLEAVYGQGINSNEYLRRFIDLEYILPKTNSEKFTLNLFQRFGFEEFFNKRKHEKTVYDKSNVIDTFNFLCDIFDLNLRAREQCLTQLRIVMMTTPEDGLLYPYITTTLAVLKQATPDAYREYATEEGMAVDVVTVIEKAAGGTPLIESHVGQVISAELLAAKIDPYDDDDRKSYKRELKYLIDIAEGSEQSEEKRKQAKSVIDFVNNITPYRNSIPLKYVVGKLEIAAKLK